jgi:putative colanic acid biosynthesis acetyltransferase WcaB
MHISSGKIGIRGWVTQDWEVNRGRRDSQLILAWFRLAQWARDHWGRFASLVLLPYWAFVYVVVGVELPVDARIGPRLRLYHPHTIVINPHASMGSDCHLRHGVTIGNRFDREGHELPSPRLGDHVELGAGCVVLGDIDVGSYARVGALAVLLESVPPGAVAVGNPARVVRVDPPHTD